MPGFDFLFDLVAYYMGYVLWWFFNLTKNYGLAIILFTLTVKFMLFPLTIKQQRAMIGQSRLMEKDKELRNLYYKTNRQKYLEEYNKLLQSEQRNPFSGCLTQLASFVFLIAVFYVINNPLKNILHIATQKISDATQILKTIPGFENIQGRYSQIDIIKVFSSHQSEFNFFSPNEANNILILGHDFNLFGMNLFLSPRDGDFLSFLWLIPVLYFFIQIFSIFLNRKMKDSQPLPEGQGCMKFMMYILPLFMVYFTINIPAAVGVYWIISGIVDLVQRNIINKFFNANILEAHSQKARIERLILEEKN
jgi:YidC/Oxa1 family membrane protein insertase